MVMMEKLIIIFIEQILNSNNSSKKNSIFDGTILGLSMRYEKYNSLFVIKILRTSS